MSEVILNGANGTNYMTSGIYESYIENQIANQERLAYYLREAGVISEAAASNIIALNEAKFSDNIKAKWNKFLAFIKGIAAKFMESMSNLLLSEKSYLEKYKDIILKKKPREDLEYSYTGDYDEGIDRLIKTECPIFNYEKHAEALRKDGYADIIKIVMAGRDFTYNEAETLPNLFKAYYIAAERGVHKGKFTDLNMTNLYNFCYNFKKIEDIVKKDQNHLEQTTSQITAAIQKQLRERGENTSDVKTTDQAAAKPQSGKSGGSDTATNDNGSGAAHSEPTTVSSDNSGQSGKQESGAYGYGHYFNEAEDKVKVGTGLNITNTSATSQMGSYNKNTSKNVTDDEKNANATAAANDKTSTEEDINKITNKWISVCRPLITAKLTACEQIARDYMTIIRAHIRSYGGDTKNANDDKSPQQGTNYQKPQPEENKEQK